MPSPAGGRHSRKNSRTGPPRTLPSPTIPNARLVRHAATVDYLPSAPAIPGTLAMQMHIADVPTEAGADDPWTRSVTRSQPPSPRTAPPKLRTKPIPPAPPPMSWIVTSHPQPPGAQKTPLSPTPITAGTLASSARSPDTTPPTSAGSALHDEREDAYSVDAYSVDAYSVDAPLHSHPLEPLSDTDSLAAPPMTPIDVFVDDLDASMMSRSPSPIRYARPDSRGNLSSDDEGLGGGGGSTASEEEDDDERASPGLRRRRRQLRSYRKSYRPREGGEPPHIPYLRRSPSPALRTEKEREKEKGEAKKKRSYFGDYMGSVPTTRTSSPERMSRSRQPRKLASAVSLALEEAHSKGTQDASASPKRGRLLVLEDEVLDIKRTSPLRQDGEDAPRPDTGSSQTSSARSSAKFGWVKAMARKRSEVFDESERGTQAHAFSRLSSAGAAPVELAGVETPYKWISAPRDAPGAPLLPLPPPPPLRANHRLTASVELDGPRASPQPWGTFRAGDGEVEAYGAGCFPTAPPSRSTPASSISVPGSAFAAFGIISRNRKAPKHGAGDGGASDGA